MKKMLLFSVLTILTGATASIDCRIPVDMTQEELLQQSLEVNATAHKAVTPAWKRYPSVAFWGVSAIACGAGSAVYGLTASSMMYDALYRQYYSRRIKWDQSVPYSSVPCLAAISLGSLSCYCGEKAIQNWRRK